MKRERGPVECYVARRPTQFVTSINAELKGGHYWVAVFLDHECAGELCVREDELPKLVVALDLMPER